MGLFHHTGNELQRCRSRCLKREHWVKFDKLVQQILILEYSSSASTLTLRQQGLFPDARALVDVGPSGTGAVGIGRDGSNFLAI